MDKTIMVVDDRDSISNAITEMLSLNGWTVVGSPSTGAEAISLFKERRPAYILMDILLPDMSGLDAAKRIIEECPKCKIFAISASTEPGIRERALEVGCRGFLAKPFKMKELMKLLENPP